jgi:hypothetical protein
MHSANSSPSAFSPFSLAVGRSAAVYQRRMTMEDMCRKSIDRGAPKASEGVTRGPVEWNPYPATARPAERELLT